MHKQHFASPLEASLHLAPSVAVRPAAGQRAYFHHLNRCYRTRWGEILRSFQRLHGGMGREGGSNCWTVGGRSRCSPGPLEAFLTSTLCGRCRLPTYREDGWVHQEAGRNRNQNYRKVHHNKYAAHLPSFLM